MDIDFPAFLEMTGNTNLLELLREIDEIRPIPKSEAARLSHLVRIHMATGSIPSIVESWVRTHDFDKTDREIDQHLEALVNESAAALSLKIEQCRSMWYRLPAQIARENTRFHNTKPKDEANGYPLDILILYLVQEGIIYRVRKIDKPRQPVESFIYQSQYKYYFLDSGLFRRLAKLPARTVNQELPELSRFRGNLTEGYALTALLKLSDHPIWYWKSGHRAEVDFVTILGNEIIPVEVKTARNVKSHSLACYRRQYGPKIALRISMLNLKQDDELVNIPLYMIHEAQHLLSLTQ
ncbi:DUF4143 domain-containing protein [Pleomorphochaeta sp. DL1XJH-081]|uniref:DUF4143 domain-containing protein n=1 Tax=Pleomorphochaeta sp. DL1XJH-081 TaxID=3409690 RepID=UPI003BB7620E